MNKLKSMNEALDLIQDGDTVASSGFVLGVLPDSVMKAIGERFDQTGHPRDLTWVHCASQGTKGCGLDYVAKPGLIRRDIGAHFGLTPNLGEIISSEQCEAYNFPQGVLVNMYRAAIQGQKKILSKVGLRTFVDPRLEGGKMNSVTKEELVKLVELEGEEYLYYQIPDYDIGIIRGTTADPEGNITVEHEPCKMEILQLAMGVKARGGKVIVQVKHLSNDIFTADRILIPGQFVDAVVVSPNPEQEHRQSCAYFYNASYSGHFNVPLDSIPPLDMSVRKVLVRRAAMELKPQSVINLGIGIPEGVAAVAAEEGFADELTMTAENGMFGGVPGNGPLFGNGLNLKGVFDMGSMFDFYDGGGLDLAVLGLAEVNANGDINVGRIGKKCPGCGGFINITQNTHNLIFCGTFTSGGADIEISDSKLNIKKEGRIKKFVGDVQQITFSADFGRMNGQNVLYVTERAVFRLTEKGLMLTEIAPGVDLEKDILQQMGFKPLIAEDLKLMDERIFRDEPMGLTI